MFLDLLVAKTKLKEGSVDSSGDNPNKAKRAGAVSTRKIMRGTVQNTASADMSEREETLRPRGVHDKNILRQTKVC